MRTARAALEKLARFGMDICGAAGNARGNNLVNNVNKSINSANPLCKRQKKAGFFMTKTDRG
jgi:hypothetical protein